MEELIEALLVYSRLERRSFVLGQVDLPDLVEQVLREYQEEIHQRGIQIVKAFSYTSVVAEREGLLLVLHNLIDNAIKFTASVPEPRIEIGAREQENTCLIWVKDNGIGFDMKYHDRIFEIFQRLQRIEEYPGTGIGLAIVRKAIERMGGKVWAESTPGSGATFYLEVQK